MIRPVAVSSQSCELDCLTDDESLRAWADSNGINFRSTAANDRRNQTYQQHNLETRAPRHYFLLIVDRSLLLAREFGQEDLHSSYHNLVIREPVIIERLPL